MLKAELHDKSQTVKFSAVIYVFAALIRDDTSEKILFP